MSQPSIDAARTARISERTRGAMRLLLGCVVGLLSAAVFAGAEAGARLVVQGEAIANGLFDPSLEVDPTTGTPWLTYSVVYGSSVPWGPNVESHVASTADGGQSWVHEADLNASEPGQILLDGVVETGFWNREVSSLVYDATDPGSEWKLIVHKIFRLDTSPFSESLTIASHSWLEIHEAASPTGPWQRVTRLGSGPLPPAEYPIDQALNALDASLQSVLVYSEPGLFHHDGRLYLSLSAIAPASPADFLATVVLLSSADHGATWDWVGPLLTPDDALPLGYLDFGGSAIVEDAGRIFLLASPGTLTNARLGTAIFEFADLATGALVEDADGPRMFGPISLMPAAGGVLFGGQADYHEAVAGGILMNQLETALGPEVFQIRETGWTPLPEPSRAMSLMVGGALLPALARRRAKRSLRV